MRSQRRVCCNSELNTPVQMKNFRSLVLFLIAALAAASMWFYIDRILVARQIEDASAHDRPRGNLSDLYPRWVGARELLLRGRNPYSNEITLEIQEGYYGRVLNAARPDDPKDQQGFAYPIYVVFLLAPLIHLTFHQAQIFFHWLLVLVTAGTAWLWLRVLRWRVPILMTAIAIVLTLGSVPAVQGIKLQQLSLLVAALMGSCAACIASDLLFCGGALLALATIKPQLAWLLGLWLLLWAFADWRSRRRFLYGFGFTMALLLAGAEIVLPGWLPMFARALAQYHRYTQNQSVLDQLVPWGPAGKFLSLLALAVCLPSFWKLRTAEIDSREFGDAIALLMALTVLIVPMYAPYNQVLLIPAVLLALRDRTTLLSPSRTSAFVFVAGGFALCWQWIASLALSGGYLLISPTWAMKGWKLPFFATFALPVLVFLLTLVLVRMRHQNSLPAQRE
jgi:hypothetical protein